MAIIAATIASTVAAMWWWSEVLLLFGPPEYAALIAFALLVATVLSRQSRIRAIGMALLGLLLAAVGLDEITGQVRLTMGIEPLIEGIAPPVVLLGLIIVADSLICLVSPSLLFATYARLVDGWVGPQVPNIAAACLRVAAALAIAAVCYAAFALSSRAWEIGLLLCFGVFGVACKIFAWNRLIFLLAFAYGNMLEKSVRQSMLISQGDPTIFVWRPISATLFLLAGCMLALVFVLSARRALSLRRPVHASA